MISLLTVDGVTTHPRYVAQGEAEYVAITYAVTVRRRSQPRVVCGHGSTIEEMFDDAVSKLRSRGHRVEF